MLTALRRTTTPPVQPISQPACLSATWQTMISKTMSEANAARRKASDQHHEDKAETVVADDKVERLKAQHVVLKQADDDAKNLFDTKDAAKKQADDDAKAVDPAFEEEIDQLKAVRDDRQKLMDEFVSWTAMFNAGMADLATRESGHYESMDNLILEKGRLLTVSEALEDERVAAYDSWTTARKGVKDNARAINIAMDVSKDVAVASEKSGAISGMYNASWVMKKAGEAAAALATTVWAKTFESNKKALHKKETERRALQAVIQNQKNQKEQQLDEIEGMFARLRSGRGQEN